jgi:hypothetical protein
VVYNRKFISLFWVIAPTGRNRIPNAARQPLVLVWVRRAGWSFTASDIVGHVIPISTIVWQYPRENLIGTGQLCQKVGWSTKEENTSKEVIAME